LKIDVGESHNCGSREEMEDRHYFDPDFRGQKELLVGVYDGHDGDRVVNYIEKEWHQRFLEILGQSSNFLESFVLAYEKISAEVCQLGWSSGACMANFILVQDQVYWANAGDVRILVVGPSVRQLTIDHHPNHPTEKKRIIACGGIIKGNNIISNSGYIAVSRAIGDPDYHSYGLIATPETGRYKLKPTDLALVVASDGLFEEMTNQDVAKIVREDCDAKETAKNLVRTALHRNSLDNVTAVVVKFIKP